MDTVLHIRLPGELIQILDRRAKLEMRTRNGLARAILYEALMTGSGSANGKPADFGSVNAGSSPAPGNSRSEAEERVAPAEGSSEPFQASTVNFPQSGASPLPPAKRAHRERVLENLEKQALELAAAKKPEGKVRPGDVCAHGTEYRNCRMTMCKLALGEGG